MRAIGYSFIVIIHKEFSLSEPKRATDLIAPRQTKKFLRQTRKKT